MTVASLCLILLVLWTLLAYVSLPLPLGDPLFAWLRRQWLAEGAALLTFLGAGMVVTLRWRRRALSMAPWWTAWLVWIAWAGCSVLYSIDHGASLRSWCVFISYGLLAQLAAWLAHSPSDGLRWMRFLGAVAATVSLAGVLQYVQTFATTLPMLNDLQRMGVLSIQGWGVEVMKDFLERKRIFSVFGWPNLFAGFLLLMIPVTIGLCGHTRARPERLVWGLVCAVLAACLVLTLSLGGWIAAILTASIAWWLFVRQREGARQPWAGGRGRLPALLALGLIVSVAVLGASLIVARRARPWIEGSLASRVTYAHGGWNIVGAAPWLGTGLGTFGTAYHALKPHEATEGAHTALHAHNTLLEVWAELGTVGLAMFLSLLWRIGRLLGAPPEGGTGPSATRWLRWGLAVGLLGFLIHSLLEQTFFEAVTAPFWWIVLGLLTGLGTGSLRGSEVGGTKRWHQVAVPVSAVIGLLLLIRFVSADAWACRAALLDLAGRHRQVEDAFNQARRWDPWSSRYALEQGERLWRWAQSAQASDARAVIQRAEHAFTGAVQLSPWLGYAWMRLGMARWRLGESGEAIIALREAVRRDPNSRAAALHLANMLRVSGRTEELRSAAERLRRLGGE